MVAEELDQEGLAPCERCGIVQYVGRDVDRAKEFRIRASVSLYTLYTLYTPSTAALLRLLSPHERERGRLVVHVGN